jgi:hypothetical protein
MEDLARTRSNTLADYYSVSALLYRDMTRSTMPYP